MLLHGGETFFSDDIVMHITIDLDRPAIFQIAKEDKGFKVKIRIAYVAISMIRTETFVTVGIATIIGLTVLIATEGVSEDVELVRSENHWSRLRWDFESASRTN